VRGRLARVVLVIAGVVSGYYAVRLIRDFRAERRQTQVFSAERADDLLNPLRSIFMPARRTLDKFDLQLGQTVLEIGPGPGYYTPEASGIIGPSGRLICLDVQLGMIARLVDRIGENANVTPLVGDATHLPLRDASIDRAYLVTVLGEIPDPSSALSELRRVLSSDGVVAIDETMRDSDYVRLGRLRELCISAGLKEIAHHRSLLGYTALLRAT
jgi:ubiquinone/menaquinone biosynthesis C-methylase UbiE